MANQEHLALIRQGVTVWNEWYEKNKSVIPDLAQANLNHLNLSGINLQRANLNHANLSNTDLTNAQLIDANLEGANFLAADLQNANLKGANLDRVIFSQAKLNAKTKIAPKSRKIWKIVNNLAENKDFNGIDLRNSNLFRANLSQADLSHAKLENANLTGANLNNAYLLKADLTGANLQNADLRNAYFSQANLTNVSFNNASCCGTYFKDAELKFANFKQAKFSHKTIIDRKWYSVWEIVNCGAVKKNLSGADLSNANLQGVDLSGANLTNANLSHAILRYSNLDRANLTNTDLAGANISGVDLNKANLKGAKLRSVVGRDTQLPVAVKSVNKTNVAIEEKSTTIPAATPSITPEASVIQEPNQSKNKSVFGLLLLAIITLFVAGCYTFLSQNPEFSWQQLLQMLQPRKEKLEQLIPAN